MLYNKNQFTKTNDKKVLHKVGKHWVAISLATLMALGGLSMAKDVSAHADTDATNGSNIDNTNAIKERLNSNLKQASSQNQPNQQATAQKNAQPSSQSINNQANALHNRILANAAVTQKQSNGLGQGRVANQKNNNSTLRNRITSNASSVATSFSVSNANQPSVGASMAAPSTPEVGNPNYDYQNSDVPVTLAYVNSDGSVQKHINSNGSVSDRVFQSNVTLTGDNDSAASLSYNVPSGYSLANSTFSFGDEGKSAISLTASIANGSYFWTGNSLEDYKQKTSDGTSDGPLAIQHAYKNGVGGYANWDRFNNDPLFVVAPVNSASAINVKFENVADGSILSSEVVSGNSSADYGDFVNVWENSANSNFGYKDQNGNQNTSADFDVVSNANSEGNDQGYYQLTDKSRTVTIPVEGRQTTESNSGNPDTVHVTFNLYNHAESGASYANSPASSFTADIHMMKSATSDSTFGRIGQTYNITPSDFTNGGIYQNAVETGTNSKVADLLTHYDPNNSDETSVSLVADGYNADGPVASANNNNITLDYYAKPNYNNGVGNMTVNFTNQNGSNVGTGTVTGLTNSDYGKSINVTSSNSGNIDGPSAPAGYHLDVDDNVNYKVNSDPQTIDLAVTGNVESASVSITPTLKYNGSNSTVSPFSYSVSGIAGDSYTIKGGQLISAFKSANPTLASASVSGSDTSTLTFNGETPSLANKDFHFTADTGDYLKANTNYKNTIEYISVSDMHRGAGQSINPETSINYRGGSDVSDGGTPINSMNKSDFLTTVSDTGTHGQNFSDKSYLKNVPEGYQFYKIYSTTDGNGNTNNNTTQGLSNFGSDNADPNAKLGDRKEVIEVIPDAQDITFNYIDQNGHTLKSYVASGIIKSAGSASYVVGSGDSNTSIATAGSAYSQSGEQSYNTNYGLNITASDIDHQNTNQTTDNNALGVPYGYEVATPVSDASNTGEPGYNDGANGSFAANSLWQNGVSFTRDPQTVNVMVVGKKPSNPNDDTSTITIHELDSDGNQTNQYNISNAINGRIGDSFTVNGATYTPAGYDFKANDTPSQQYYDPSTGKYTGEITPGGVMPNEMNFYYQKKQVNANELQPITVYFHDGTHIVDAEVLYGVNGKHNGQQVNISDNSDVTPNDNNTESNAKLPGYQNPPLPYQVVPGQNMNTYLSTNPTRPIYIDVYDPSKESTGLIHVTRHLFHKNSAGSLIHNNMFSDNMDITDTNSLNGKNTYSASSYSIDGYSAFASSGVDSDATSNTATMTGSGVTPDHWTWDYSAENTKNDNNGSSAGFHPIHPSDNGPVGPKTSYAEPIYVQYYDGNKGDTSHPLSIGSLYSLVSGNLENNVNMATSGSDDIRVDGYMDQNFNDIGAQALEDAEGNNYSNRKDKQYTDVPDGYHFNGYQNLDRKIGTREQQVDLFVSPNGAPNSASAAAQNISIYERTPSSVSYNANGTIASVKWGSFKKVSTPKQWINGDQASDITPSDYRPLGYSDANSDGNGNRVSDASYTIANKNGQLYSDNNGALNTDPNPINYYFEINPNGNSNNNNPDMQVQPIYVQFYNKLGQKVGNQYKVHGYKGQTFSDIAGIATGHKGKVNSTNGQPINNDSTPEKNYVPSDYSDDYTLDPNSQNKGYTIGNQVQYANLLLDGENTSNIQNSSYAVNIHAYDGNSEVSSFESNVSSASSAKFGSDFTVTPSANLSGTTLSNNAASDNGSNMSDYTLVSSAFVPTNSSATVQVYQSTSTSMSTIPNGQPSAGSKVAVSVAVPAYNPATTKLTYIYAKKPVANTNEALTVQYEDADNNDQIVGAGVISNQKAGTIISDVTADPATPIPDGYQLQVSDPMTDPQDTSYQFKDNTPTDNKVVYVVGNPVNDNKHNITVTKIMKTQAGSMSTSDVQGESGEANNAFPIDDVIPGNYRVGETAKLTASDFTPTGYKTTNSDHPEYAQIVKSDVNPNHFYFFYDQVPSDNSGNIYLKYVNQNGDVVNTNGYVVSNNVNGNNGNSDPYTISYKNGQGYDQKVILSDAQSQDGGNTNGVSVPYGYSLDPGQNTKYYFGHKDQNVILLVHGDPSTQRRNKANKHQTNPNNPTPNKGKNSDNINSDNSDNQLAINIYENGKFSHTVHQYINSDLQPGLSVGDIYHVDASRFTPSGFYVNKMTTNGQQAKTQSDQAMSDNDQSIGINAKGGIDPDAVNFNYDPINNKSGVLTVKYINQNGDQVGYSDNIVGNEGQKVSDVTKGSDGGETMPAGYNWDSKYGHQQTSYVLPQQNDPKTVILHVMGQTNPNDLTINMVYKHSDGTFSTHKKIDHLNGHIGDSVTVDPQSYVTDPSDSKKSYSVDYTRDSIHQVAIQNGQVSNPSNLTFYYNADETTGAPIFVRYVNQNGQQIGGVQTLNGDIGKQTQQIGDGNIANGGFYDSAETPGYSLDTSYNNHSDNNQTTTAYTFSNSPQNEVVHLIGNNENQNFKLGVITEDANGKNAHTTNVNVGINGHVGDTVKISPYGFAGNHNGVGHIAYSDDNNQDGSVNNSDFVEPTGYHATNSDSDMNVNINADGTISPVNSDYFVYQRASTQPTVGHIVVHYITSDQTNDNNNVPLPGQQSVLSDGDLSNPDEKYDPNAGTATEANSNYNPFMINGKPLPSSDVALKDSSKAYQPDAKKPDYNPYVYNNSKLFKGYHEIDQESDAGIASDASNAIKGDTMNLKPYLDDLPENMSNFYTLADNHIYDSVNTTADSNDDDHVTKDANNNLIATYQKNTLNFYVKVHHNNNGPIIID